MVEAMEVVELYCDLPLAHFGMIVVIINFMIMS